MKNVSAIQRAVACLLVLGLGFGPSYAQTAEPPAAPVPFRVDLPSSHNPLSAYRPSTVPEPNHTSSARLYQLIRDGKLYLSLQDAIDLALENNLDLAIARYNMPIADTDVLRTRAGGSFRGVNTGVVQGTPGGGGTGLSGGGGAGGTTGGAGGAGTGATGVVQSTLGAGTAVSGYDPVITGNVSLEHYTSPQANRAIYGVPSLQANTTIGNFGFSEAFPTGTAVQFTLNNNRQTLNSPNVYLSPSLTSYYQIAVQQQLLAGFGFGPNLRFLRIAKNDRRITDAAFREQVIVTITQVADIYWDLVNAYQDEQVKERSLQFARDSYDMARKQVELQAVPAMDVLKAEAEVANRDQDLTVARTNLEYQQLLIKNALTRSADDPRLEEMPVVPTDVAAPSDTQTEAPMQDLIAQALAQRPELATAAVNLQNEKISMRASRNALLPTLALTGYYGGTGLAGTNNPLSGAGSDVPPGLGGALGNAFNNSSPDYFVGLSLNIPLRNRIAKADQFRSELEFKQNELYSEQLKKRIRLEVRNAVYALEQSRARVDSARKARDLQSKTFDITAQEQKLGAGSNVQTLTAQHDLSVAESSLVQAETDYQKARVEVDRAVSSTLESNGIVIEEARSGVVNQHTP